MSSGKSKPYKKCMQQKFWNKDCGRNKPCGGGKNEKAILREEVYLALQRNSEKLSDHHFFVKGSTLS